MPVSESKAPAARPRPRVFTPPPHLPLPPRAGRRHGGPVDLAQGWYHSVLYVVAAVSKSHTPPRPFGRVHHLSSSAFAIMLRIVRPKLPNSNTRACSICRSLGWPPATYNNHATVECSILTQEDRRRAFDDAMEALEEATEVQEEDILQGPVTPSS